jgi:hypothetical protein
MPRQIKTARGLLREARRLLETRGWTQKAYARNSNGQEIPPTRNREIKCYCLSGALQASGVGGYAYQDARQALLDAIRKMTRGRYFSLVSFNDSPRRTRTSVLRALELAEKAV